MMVATFPSKNMTSKNVTFPNLYSGIFLPVKILMTPNRGLEQVATELGRRLQTFFLRSLMLRFVTGRRNTSSPGRIT
ncbi:hypothetical protein PBCV1_a589L [Paramecium bursaria Chlorella virus 1]|uniref:Uncharacterized protein n=1 Tax=Paramecium bursaria Chlorella virus 1 TaxID=10506 RepID=O41071_PBCV1|nr:hypothetical protein PBCV1_a589L [Paramecium bursaria Chlorella virus 1]AAC97015.1 hypothetical protein [Paramecium bursaria Chlorella virus 1]